MINQPVPSLDIIRYTLACFTELCVEKKERPCFISDSRKIDKFFYKRTKEYHEMFKRMLFDINGGEDNPVSNNEIADVFVALQMAEKLYSYGIRFNPYETSREILPLMEKINPEEKEVYQDIAKKFYADLSCDRDAKLGQHTKFERLEELL
jgi:hypothetical protein